MAQRPDLRHLVAVPTGAPPLPAADIEGQDLLGRERVLHTASPGRWTLLLFLGTRCDGCLPFWSLAGAPERSGLSLQDASVVVTRGAADEEPEALAALLDAGLVERLRSSEGAHPPEPPSLSDALIMSDMAWPSYRVHGAPFFVLLDGVRVVSEGVAWTVEQVASDVARARRRAAGEAEQGPRVRR